MEIDSRPGVVMLFSAWGPVHGGINAFSTDLSQALARALTSHRLLCVVLEASNEDVRSARSWGVELVVLSLPSTEGFRVQWHSLVTAALTGRSVTKVEWWVGHDLVSGEAAIECARKQGGRSAVFMHSSVEDYAFAKHPSTSATQVAAKQARQREVLLASDVALAVGPLLLERLKEFRRNGACEMLVPGLGDVAPQAASNRLRVISFGRFGRDDFLIKQPSLVVAAFARAVKSGFEAGQLVLNDAVLSIIGAPEDVSGELRTLAEAEAGRVVNISVLPFSSDRRILHRLLCEANLCIMASWREGFGLAGWEAIAAGVPLLLSKQSGLYRLLDDIGGAATGCVVGIDIRGQTGGDPHPIDIETLRGALVAAAPQLGKMQLNARALRHLLEGRGYTWDNAARTLCAVLGVPVAVLSDRIESSLGKQLVPPAGVMEGLDVAAAIRDMTLAHGMYKRGAYADALRALLPVRERVSAGRVPRKTCMDLMLLEAEIHIRLNNYATARGLATAVARAASEMDDWDRYLQARFAENLILRDIGSYSEATRLAEELLSLAEQKSSKHVEAAHQKLARSLVLSGSWDRALHHAEIACRLAQARHDGAAEAKACLAVGEAHRYALALQAALESYLRARDLAGKCGNVDCYLWAVLGMADCLFMLDRCSEAEELLSSLIAYLTEEGHEHPLETLHVRFSLAVVQFRLKKVDAQSLKHFATEYQSRSIYWVEGYLTAVEALDFSMPKRF